MKRILVLVLVVLLASLLAGCGSEGTTSGSSAPAATATPAPAANIAVSAQMPPQMSEQEIINAMPQSCYGWLEGYSQTPYYLCGKKDILMLMGKTPTVRAPWGRLRVEIVSTSGAYATAWENGVQLNDTNVPAGDFQIFVTKEMN